MPCSSQFSCEKLDFLFYLCFSSSFLLVSSWLPRLVHPGFILSELPFSGLEVNCLAQGRPGSGAEPDSGPTRLWLHSQST